MPWRDGRMRVAVVGLRVPADQGEPVGLVAMELSAVALSIAIGGGLLDEAWCGQVGRSGFTVYLDEDRVVKGLAGNQRAAVLSARLGNVERDWLASLRGDALLLGRDARQDDTDVPVRVLSAAWQGGLLTDCPHV